MKTFLQLHWTNSSRIAFGR